MKYLLASILLNLGRLFCQDLHDNVWVVGRTPNDLSRFFGGTEIQFINNNLTSNPFNINFYFVDAACISDESGNLVAYSNGCNIQNHEHILLTNGDTLYPGSYFNSYCKPPYIYYPTRNSMLFIPKIDDEGYLLFQLVRTENGPSTVMQITHIDKTQNAYSISKKEQIKFFLEASHGIQAIRHGNGRDWWVIVKQVPGNQFMRFLYSPDGISGPYFQKIGPEWSRYGAIVQTAFSSDGKWYASQSEHNGVSLFRFNRCLGTFTEFIKLVHPPRDTSYWFPRGGVCFSPNNRYLYVTAFYGLYQYDLNSSTIANSGILIDTIEYNFTSVTWFPSSFYQMLPGPDGRIYCNTSNETNYFHIIHFPDKKGKQCLLKQHDVFFPTTLDQSMPNFAHYRTYDWDGSPCDTLGINKLPRANFRYVQDSLDFKLIEFVDLSAYQATSWSWDFGDPNSMQNTSKDQHPIHQFSDKGSFRVCLTATNRHGNHIFCDTLHIGTVSADDVPPIEIEHRVVMMPNPCSDILYFNFNNYLPQHLTVKISTLSGQLCMQTRISPLHNKLRIDQLLPGAYYVQLFENGVLIKREMMVKE